MPGKSTVQGVHRKDMQFPKFLVLLYSVLKKLYETCAKYVKKGNETCAEFHRLIQAAVVQKGKI